MHSHSTRLQYRHKSADAAYRHQFGIAQRLLAHGCHLSVHASSGRDMTRLLRQLVAMTEGNEDARECVRIYFDLPRLTLSEPEEFFDALLGALRREITRIGPLGTDVEACRYSIVAHDSFRRLRAALCFCERHNLRVDFLIDGVEHLIQSPRFDVPFFGALRHLGGGAAVTFVCTSSMPLHELSWATPASGSPFWNLFVQLSLTAPREEIGHSCSRAQSGEPLTSAERYYVA